MKILTTDKNKNLLSKDTDFKFVSNGCVYRFVSETVKQDILTNYHNIVDKKLQKYLPKNICINRNMITYQYVEGRDLEYCYSIRMNYLYAKMLFELWKSNCYIFDLSRRNVIFDGEKIVIIDLDCKPKAHCTKWQYAKECLYRFRDTMVNCEAIIKRLERFLCELI